MYRETNKQTRSRSPRIAIRGFLSALCLIWVVGPSGGCGASRRPVVQLDAHVERPESAVLLVTVDGLGADRFDEFLAAGALPHIQHPHPKFTHLRFTCFKKYKWCQPHYAKPPRQTTGH